MPARSLTQRLMQKNWRGIFGVIALALGSLFFFSAGWVFDDKKPTVEAPSAIAFSDLQNQSAKVRYRRPNTIPAIRHYEFAKK